MKIAVVGIGAVGGVIASKIDREYAPVMISKNKEIVKSIRENGLRVKKEKATHCNVNCCPRIYSSFKEADLKFDIILLCTKATNVIDAAKEALNYLSEIGFIVSFQNGIVENHLLEFVPEEKLVGGIIGFGATMHQPGFVEMTSHGEIVIGELNGCIKERIKVLKSILDSVIETRITQNIWGAKYSKLLINACITTMGAVSGLTLGEMLSKKEFREVFRKILYEGVEVAKKKGIKLEKISGVSIHKLAASEREINGKFCLSKFHKDLIIKFIGRKYKNLKSSSLQSLERGRKTEVDFINGIIVRYGKETGFETPVNERIVEIVHEIENGKRKISPENLRELIF
ncbi:2-dehydropantoate 2-reductase [Thermotomaculum hydrothermale]|uniref:2-dehydropantoate 2-reductase n=1 Tax=Thermotomaculum hydrothermale TaxID=981385 RepID=A0A7R6SZ11_9BACT|nr:ketopantoate reductase family protein [Thermotomaculum hydrothermale]BBB32282.1 2-dehydropantoate 2-reductase [Thermotomaculum hydrothermale]